MEPTTSLGLSEHKRLTASGPPPMITTVDAARRNVMAATTSVSEMAARTARLSCGTPVMWLRYDAGVLLSELAARPNATELPSTSPPPPPAGQEALSTVPYGESERRKPSPSVLSTGDR